MGRSKQVIGDVPRSRTDKPRATETNVVVHVPNLMPEFGRPNYGRTA